MTKKILLSIAFAIVAVFAVAQPTTADIVLLLDTSGTMVPFYDQINTQVLTEITSKFIRNGDTVHLISFSEKPNLELSQKITSEEDVQKLVSRINLLYPVGPYTDLTNAVTYTDSYINKLRKSSDKVLVLISDGLYSPAPGSQSENSTPEQAVKTISDTLNRLNDKGVHTYWVKAPFPEGAVVADLNGNIISGNSYAAPAAVALEKAAVESEEAYKAAAKTASALQDKTTDEAKAISDAAEELAKAAKTASETASSSAQIIAESDKKTAEEIEQAAKKTNEAYKAASEASNNAYKTASELAQKGENITDSDIAKAVSDLQKVAKNDPDVVGDTLESMMLGIANKNANPDYYSYTPTVQENENVTTAEITEESEQTGIFDSLEGLPVLSGRNDMGDRNRRFMYPVSVDNTKDEAISLVVTSVLVDGKNILDDQIQIDVEANGNANAKIPFNFPESFPYGDQIITAYFVFADNARTTPQELTFSVCLVSESAFLRFIKANWLWLLIALLILLGILLIIFALNSSSGRDSTKSQKKVSDDDSTDELNKTKINSSGSMPALEKNASSANGSMPVLGKAGSASNGSFGSTKKTGSASNGSFGTGSASNGSFGSGSASNGSFGSLGSASNGSLPALNASGFKASGSMPTLGAAGTKSPSSASSSTLVLPQKSTLTKKSNVKPASATDPIEKLTDDSLTLDFIVDGQTRNIGFRNIHAMTAGSRKTIGGGFSTFSIFLVQVPSSIAEIRYNGKECSLALLKPEYFPYETKNIINNCIGKTFIVRSDTGYEMGIHFEPYVSQTDKLNEVLLSLVPEEDKKKYL